MGRGYSPEEVRRRLIPVLGGSESGMSGVEIASRIGIGRITVAKYLEILASEGLLRRREVGSTTLWSLDPGQEAYEFPADYFRAAEAYLESLLAGSSEGPRRVLSNCIRSGAGARRLVLEVVMPAAGSVACLFDEGKIGTAERSLMMTAVSRSLCAVPPGPAAPGPARSAVVIAADAASAAASGAAAAAWRSEGWRVFELGDMSTAMDVLFDMDFGRLVGRIRKGRRGPLLVAVFSATEGASGFFADSIRPIRARSGRGMRLALCGAVPDGAKCDLAAADLGEVLRWSDAAGGAP